VIYIHFNKRGVNSDRPWTVHYRGQCIPASWVNIKCRSETIYKPDKRHSPRAFIRCFGTVKITSRNNNVVIQ
jgi:hypothetical protein